MSQHTRKNTKPRVRLLRLGADPNKQENDRYDIITIAAVANDVPMLKIALEGGGNPRAITSRYDGTALIAAAHLGHAEVVRTLIAAGAPLDHVNNLGWTALIESIVLGDGGKNHTDTLSALVKAGAKVNLADSSGATPLALARGARLFRDGPHSDRSRRALTPQAGRRASDSQMPPPISTAPDMRPSNFARDGFMNHARPRPDAMAQPESKHPGDAE